MNSPISSSIIKGVETSEREGNRKNVYNETDLKKPALKVSASAILQGKGSELDAANTLTSLVTSASNSPVPSTEEVNKKEADKEDGDFHIPERFTRSGRKKAVPFTLKLMKVLSMKEFSDILTWLPDGKSFVIMKPKLFTQKVLPIYFKDAKFSSFTRKLHRWGFFKRHLGGDESGSFYHKNFQRGRLDLADKMTCYQKSNASKKFVPQQNSSKNTSRVPSSLATSQEVPQLSCYEMAEIDRLQAQASRGLADPRGTTVHEDLSTFDIAVELEVTRRLRERISSAAASNFALGATELQRRPLPYVSGVQGFPSQQREYHEFDARAVSSSISRELGVVGRSSFGGIPGQEQRAGTPDERRNLRGIALSYTARDLVQSTPTTAMQSRDILDRARDLLGMPSPSATEYARDMINISSQRPHLSATSYRLPLANMARSVPSHLASRPAILDGAQASSNLQEDPCSTRLGMGRYDQPLNLMPMDNIAHAKTA
eukprot:CAMPEP_0195281444 /NCGR_PEP_ID=MMETSP0707-20130614/749_1 /TAXON_ID=33640 /ORGANISM="Asterionellopsis glacialis, Strain CCMP134" /LENGTH=486 /DNA_ID=CAMNT_0040340327 /DNA_START=40 /DNA_END=1500 /DNA_ORIENTATION=+